MIFLFNLKSILFYHYSLCGVNAGDKVLDVLYYISFSCVAIWWGVVVLILASIVWILLIVIVIVFGLLAYSGKNASEGLKEENKTRITRTTYTWIERRN